MQEIYVPINLTFITRFSNKKWKLSNLFLGRAKGEFCFSVGKSDTCVRLQVICPYIGFIIINENTPNYSR
jgi:hypothetical protein